MASFCLSKLLLYGSFSSMIFLTNVLHFVAGEVFNIEIFPVMIQLMRSPISYVHVISVRSILNLIF